MPTVCQLRWQLTCWHLPVALNSGLYVDVVAVIITAAMVVAIIVVAIIHIMMTIFR